MEQEIKHGIEPVELDKRDFSFLRTFGAISGVQLPASFDLDANLYPVPNQNLYNEFFNIPALPFGCTEYTANELCTDEDKIAYDPMFTESLVHANAKGGIDMRTPLASVCDSGVLSKGNSVYGYDSPYAVSLAKESKRAAYFRVGQNPDYFDGVRTAMFSNNRSVSVGTPWFGEWSAAGWGSIFKREADGTITTSAGGTKTGIMPMPDVKNISGLPWHCYKVSGWVVKNGVTYLKGKPWCGPDFAENGFIYISREVFNAVMTIYGTAAFTVAKAAPAQIKTVGIAYIFRKNLNYGALDMDVAELQKALQSLGYTIVHAVTTNFLDETKDALAKFQKDHNIDDDGTHFGPMTRYAINKILNPAQTLFGSVVLFAQTFLNIW